MLNIAYLRGHIPKDVYFNRNALMRWWDRIDDERRNKIVSDCIAFIKAEDERQEWHKKKFSITGWRAWLAGTIPALVAIRWLVYAPGEQKWWAIAIFLGGGILMRWLINIYDNLRGNPRRVYEIEEDKGAKTSSHFVDIFFIILGIVLITIAALINVLAMLIIGIILTTIGLLFFFLRKRYAKKGEFPKWW